MRNLLGVVLVDTGDERKAARSDHIDGRKVLSISSGRDRLTHNTAYHQLKHLVRASLDLYANLFRGRYLASEKLKIQLGLSAKAEDRLRTILGALTDEIDEETVVRINGALNAYTRTKEAEVRSLRRSLGLFGAIATAGMNAIAFSHELSRETRALETVVDELREFGESEESATVRRIAERLAKSVNAISSLRSLFSTVVDADDREQAKRLSARLVLDETIDAMRPLLPGIRVSVDDVPKSLRLPIGTMAEWSAVFQNVLSNAWNALLKVGRNEIHFSGVSSGKSCTIRVSDRGAGLGVDPSEAEAYFEPFARALELQESLRPMMIGGQGAGLAIVRMIAESRGAEVRFVEPEEGYSTTFELSWREK